MPSSSAPIAVREGSMLTLGVGFPQVCGLFVRHLAGINTQPFVENAIIHGLQQREMGGRVTIVFSKKQDSLAVSISDNGTGFDTVATSDAKPHHSVGMMLTQKRLDMLSGVRAERLSRETLRDEEGNVEGARVAFEIPV